MRRKNELEYVQQEDTQIHEIHSLENVFSDERVHGAERVVQ
jgi:hypothetical protein